MNIITNEKDCYVLIPECKQASVKEWGKLNGYKIVHDSYDPGIKTYIPYREPYGRIMRAVAADLHEILYVNNIVNLNFQKWGDVKDTALDYFDNIIDDLILPREPGPNDELTGSHTGYLTAYLHWEIKDFEFIDVEDMQHFPSLPDNFYDYTVPFWEIEKIYQTDARLQKIIDEWIAQDQLSLQEWLDAQR